MAWKFDKVRTTSVPNAKHMLFDGRDVWVSANDNVRVFGYWDENSNFEGIHGEYYPDFIESSSLYSYANIDVSSYLTGTEELGQIVKHYEDVYIEVVDFTETISLPDTDIDRYELKAYLKFNIPAKTYTSRINVTVTNASPGSCCQNNKLWFTDLALQSDDAPDKQKLYYYDISGASFSSGITIPNRKQFTDRLLVNGRNTDVILTALNNNSVMKFNDSTGVYTSETIINREPTSVHVMDDLDVLVGSADGMISVFDQIAETYSNDYATDILPNSICFDGTNIWAVNTTPKLIDGSPQVLADAAKLTRTDTTATGSPVDNFRFTYIDGSDSALDYVMETTQFDYTIESVDGENIYLTTFKEVLVTPEIDYQYYVGGSPAFEDRVVRPYIFVLSDDSISCFRKQALYRQNKIQVRGGAMIGTGPEVYYGETE